MDKELSDKNKGVALNRFGEDYKGYYPHRIRTGIKPELNYDYVPVISFELYI